MARLIAEFAVLLAIVVGLLYLARQVDVRRSLSNPRRALTAPPSARWQAVHAGTADQRTEVSVVLRSPDSADVWDQRVCAVIANQDPEYDRLLYNAVEDARQRAQLLNGLREG
ncbi:MAG TPA: hypothetical protein VMB79_08500 [Jatrophihabitans sp.]|nr:hypothetical protein [Jatrophihabitans sp.]